MQLPTTDCRLRNPLFASRKRAIKMGSIRGAMYQGKITPDDTEEQPSPNQIVHPCANLRIHISRSLARRLTFKKLAKRTCPRFRGSYLLQVFADGQKLAAQRLHRCTAACSAAYEASLAAPGTQRLQRHTMAAQLAARLHKWLHSWLHKDAS